MDEKELAPCNPNLYKNGINTGVYDTSYMGARGFEKIVRATAELTGRDCDWHFFAGRAVVKALEEDFVDIRNAFEAIYTYVYNTEGPKWCNEHDMGAHFRTRTPEYCTSVEDAVEKYA